MAYENLIYEKKDGIAFITFNRPKVMNALNRKTIEELQAILLDAREDCGGTRVDYYWRGRKSICCRRRYQ